VQEQASGSDSSVPIEGEAGRRHLQLRVAALARYIGLISLAFVGLRLSLGAGASLARLREPSQWADQVAIPLSLLALSAVVRRVELSRRFLVVADALVPILACGGFAFAMVAPGQIVHGDMRVLLMSTNILVARAALVPSTARRTLWTGVLAPHRWFCSAASFSVRPRISPGRRPCW
jgi:hypothetical protein